MTTGSGKVLPGTPVRNALTARNWNDFMDVAAWWRERNGAAGAEGLAAASRSDILFVRNDTGADRRVREIVGLGNPLFTHDDNPTEFRDRVSMSAERPDRDNHRGGRWAVLLDAIPEGRYGPAALVGWVTCQVYLVTDRDRTCDIVHDDVERLRGGPGPARILWSPPGVTGDQQCVISLADTFVGGVLMYTTSAVPARVDGGSPGTGTAGAGTAVIKHRDASDQLLTDNDGSDVELVVRNWTRVEIASDTWCWAEPDARGDLWITSADCGV